MKTYIGIDPGASGGIAWITSNGMAVEAMPETDKDIFDLLASIHSDGLAGGIKAVIESVHSMPRQGVASSFKFGMNFGSLKMALIASGIPHEFVTPQKWQKDMRCMTGGDKNVSKRRAQELFPAIKVTHAKADAMLLAEYARKNNL